MHPGQGSRIIDISIIIRVKDHRYMHHTHLHQDQVCTIDIRTIHVCIIHTCIRIKTHIYIYASWIHAYMHPSQGSRIIDISIIIRVMDHRYMHHTHMHHSYIHQGQGSKIYASYTPASRSRVIDICIMHRFIMQT